jgi:hypothetical protein
MESITQMVLVGMMLLTVSGEGPEAYLEPDGLLKQAITLTEEQGGIAGPRVTVNAIEPDGSFTRRSYTRFVNKDGDEEKRGETVRKGKLTKEQLGTIARELTAQKFAALPSTIGTEVKVNPRSLAIDVGLKRCTLYGAPRENPDQPLADDPQNARGRFSILARVIRKALDEGR